LMIMLIIKILSAKGADAPAPESDETPATPADPDAKKDKPLSGWATFFKDLPKHVNLVVVLVVVSIPEGLPLTIGVSLAFSVMKMYRHRILVRRLDAPEKMGGAEEICCGKTATIT